MKVFAKICALYNRLHNNIFLFNFAAHIFLLYQYIPDLEHELSISSHLKCFSNEFHSSLRKQDKVNGTFHYFASWIMVPKLYKALIR